MYLVWSTGISNRQAKELALQSNTLTELLILGDQIFSATDLTSVFKSNPQLEKVSLGGNRVDDQTMLALAELIKGSTNLQSLGAVLISIGGCKIT